MITKIKLHSVTDLITNSSTVIFTYSGGTIEPLKEMIDEIAKTLGSDKTCDDMFDTVILGEDSEIYEEYAGNSDPIEGVTEDTNIAQLYEDVVTGKVSKPEWFNEAEESENYYGYAPSTFLYLIPKDEKYIAMGKLIHSFLYSPDHEATRDG